MPDEPWWRTNKPCPHCHSFHDVSTRMHGDRMWCAYCDGWFSVVMRTDGSVYLAKVEGPLGWRHSDERADNYSGDE